LVIARTALCSLLFGGLAGCTREGKFQAISMWNESRLKPYEAAPDREGGSSSRPLPYGTVARGTPAPDDPVTTGRIGAKLVTTIPIKLNPSVLERGQERFNIYCSRATGRWGTGRG